MVHTTKLMLYVVIDKCKKDYFHKFRSCCWLKKTGAEQDSSILQGLTALNISM